MWWETKVMRMLRCRNEQRPAVLGSLLTAIGSVGGYVGEIDVVRVGQQTVTRDVTVFADDADHLGIVLEAVRRVPGVELLEVRDEVLEMHRGGKIAVRSRYPVKSISDLRRIYTPGVADVSRRIEERPEDARLYTAIPHLVAVVTDGSAVLGLGNIGSVASMPVMEGKATLIETLVGLSAIPMLLDTQDVDEIVETVVNIAPTFAAIQLEDISAPRCFEIEAKLIERLRKPVMHDDQHGTAVVVTAALMNAVRLVDRNPENVRVGQIGLGAAGLAIARMVMSVTQYPVLGADISEEAVARLEAHGGQPSSLEEIMQEADVVIATTGVKDLIEPRMVQPGQIILALSNPEPEIDPEVATEAGAAIAADGKMVNNVLGFPGILRGAVDADAVRISREMYLAAARTIADSAGLGELMPDPLDKGLHQRVAEAVARTALEQDLARADLEGYFDRL